MVSAETNRTQATIVGAAVGGVAGSAIGGDMQSTLLGAAAGGLLGNLLSQSSSNYTREGYYNSRYYYGGREFKQREDYDAYREAVRRDMLSGQEARRYQQYDAYRQQKSGSRGNSAYGHQQWQNGKGHGAQANGRNGNNMRPEGGQRGKRANEGSRQGNGRNGQGSMMPFEQQQGGRGR